jgi:hypothetical protein
LACLVLHLLLTQLNSELVDRAGTRRKQLRQSGDDGLGSVAASYSYIDDTFLFLSYDDLPWYIRQFQILGAPLGIHLNTTKTKILTVTTDSPSAPLLSPAQNTSLQEALALLTGPSSE